MNKTEYQEEYCGMKGKGKGGGRGNGGGPSALIPCRHNEDVQPVGGRTQAKFREEMLQKRQAAREVALHTGSYPRAAEESFPVTAYDGDYVCSQINASEQGTHRVQPTWRDPNMTAPTRVANSTLYEPADRDPRKRKQLYMYTTTQIHAPNSPYAPLAAPDVHKLRYMHGNYMTGDDWY